MCHMSASVARGKRLLEDPNGCHICFLQMLRERTSGKRCSIFLRRWGELSTLITYPISLPGCTTLTLLTKWSRDILRSLRATTAEAFLQQAIMLRSFPGKLMCTFDLFRKQSMECLHKIFWRAALNDFTDLLREIDGFQFGR